MFFFPFFLFFFPHAGNAERTKKGKNQCTMKCSMRAGERERHGREERSGSYETKTRQVSEDVESERIGWGVSGIINVLI